MGSEDQRRKMVASNELDSVFTDVKRLKFTPGEGSQSESDAAAIYAASPGSWQTPEFNKRKGEEFLSEGATDLQKVQFKRNYLAQRGSLVGWDVEWSRLNPQSALPAALPSAQTPTPSPTPTPTPAPSATPPVNGLPPARTSALRMETASPELVAAVVSQESDGNPNAVSSKGAQGLMQVMPETGREILAQLGIVQPDAPLDRVKQLLRVPQINKMVGTEYLNRQLAAHGGNVELALAAYNAGPKRVKDAGGVPNIPETQNYVQRITTKLGEALGPAIAEAQGPVVGLTSQPPGLNRQPTPTPTPSPTSTPTPTPVPGPTPGQPKAATRKQGNKLYDVAGSVLQGAFLGGGDELIARLRQLGGADYETELKKERQALARFRKQNPKLDTALQIAGSIPISVAIPYSAPLKGAGLLKNAGLLAASGGATGAVNGYLSGGEEGGLSRRDSAILGGGIGTVATPAISGTVGAVSKGLQIEPVRNLAFGIRELQRTLSRMAYPGAEEDGAIGASVGKEVAGAAPRITKPQLAALRLTQGSTAKDIEKALSQMIDAESRGGQLLVPEALDNPALYLQAKKLSNKPATMNIARELVDDRSAAAPDRVIRAFNDIGGADVTPHEGGLSIREAAQDILQSERVARMKANAPKFEAAFRDVPTLESDKMSKLIENPIIAKAIKQARSGVGMEDKPANSTEVIQEALETLGGKIEAMRARKLQPPSTTELRRLARAKDALEKEAEGLNPALKAARESFNKDSFKLNNLERSQVSVISRLSNDDVVGAGRAVFNLEPERIAELRKTFAQGEKMYAWDEMVRGYIRKAVESSQDGMNKTMLRPIFGSRAARSRLRAAIGDDLYNKVEPMLSLEQKYIKGAQAYFAGSPTDPLREAGKEGNAIIQIIAGLGSDGWTGAVASGIKKTAETVFKSKPNDEMEREIARILFQPQKGREFLEAAGPYMKAIERYRGSLDAAAAEASRTGSRSVVGTNLNERQKR